MHQPNSIRRYNLSLEPDTLHVLEFDLTSNVIDTSTWELEPDSVLEGYLRVHLEPPASSINTLGFLSTDTMIMELELSPEEQSVSIEFTPEVSGVSIALTWYGAGVGVWVGIIEWSDIALYRYVEPGHVQGESDNPFRFAGMYWDGHTSTYMTPNRQFSPRLGRWTQPDPFFHALHGNLQSCAFQAGNLYLFVMHNPVRWIDPLGLFAWNEADDHMFNLTHEVGNAGGTMTRSGNSVSVSIWGVTVNFDTSMDGVSTGRLDRFMVRADVFYSAVVNAAQEIMFLGGHSALGGLPIPHMHISMFVSKNSPYWYHPAFNSFGIRWGSVRHATISGNAQNDNLLAVVGVTRAISEVNRVDRAGVGYLDRSGLMFLNHLHTGTGMVTQLFAAHNHFMYDSNMRFPYALVPGHGIWGTTPPGFGLPRYNSTSVTLSLLGAVGLNHGLSLSQQAQYLGSHRRISPHHFGK